MPISQPVLCLLIAFGGAVGALCRYGINIVCKNMMGAGFPWGTMAVNVLGSMLLGLVLYHPEGRAPEKLWQMWVATGFLGALTTFSTFSFESFELIFQQGDWLRGGLNIFGNLGLCLAAVGLGCFLSKTLIFSS